MSGMTREFCRHNIHLLEISMVTKLIHIVLSKNQFGNVKNAISAD